MSNSRGTSTPHLAQVSSNQPITRRTVPLADRRTTSPWPSTAPAKVQHRRVGQATFSARPQANRSPQRTSGFGPGIPGGGCPVRAHVLRMHRDHDQRDRLAGTRQGHQSRGAPSRHLAQPGMPMGCLSPAQRREQSHRRRHHHRLPSWHRSSPVSQSAFRQGPVPHPAKLR